MWLNFPSFWCLIGDDYEMLKKVAIYTTLVILGLAVSYMLYTKMDIQNAEMFLTIAAWIYFSWQIFIKRNMMTEKTAEKTGEE